MAKSKSSGKGSKYVSILGKRKRVSAGSVLLTNALASGIQSVAEAASVPLSTTQFIKNYLPANIDHKWVEEHVGPISHEQIRVKLGFRNPVNMTICSILFGGLGIDRFIMNQPLLGLAKLISLG